MAIARTRRREERTVNPSLIIFIANLFSRIKELELKSSNIDGRLQEREGEYSRK